MKTYDPKPNNLAKHVISIILILGVMLISPLIVGSFTLFFDYTGYSYNTKMIVISILVLTIITLPCFFICKHNHRSVWYVPLIANLGTLLISNGILSNYWSSNAKVTLLLISICLAVVMSIIGSRKGKQAPQK